MFVMDICFQRPFLDSYCQVVPGEVHLGYVMTGCVVLCTCFLPVVISGGHMFLLICRIFRFYTDGLFLLCLLCPFTLTCFSLIVTD